MDLGENVVDKDPDCEDSICADPVQRLTISAIKSHEAYNKPAFKNDIALIKLRTKAKITDWVLPVCLPLKNQPNMKSISGTVEVAGFGLSNERISKRSSYLQTLKVGGSLPLYYFVHKK